MSTEGIIYVNRILWKTFINVIEPNNGRDCKQKLSNKKQEKPQNGKNCCFYSKSTVLQIQVMFGRSNPVDTFQGFGQKRSKISFFKLFLLEKKKLLKSAYCLYALPCIWYDALFIFGKSIRLMMAIHICIPTYSGIFQRFLF